MILVVAEHKNGKLAKSTYEMVSAARTLGSDVAMAVLGSSVEPLASEAASLAGKVFVADSPELAQHDAELYAAAVTQIAQSEGVETVILSGSRSGRECSPRVAVKLEAPLLEDVISLERSDNTLIAERYSFLTRVTERVQTEGPAAVVTVKPGAFAKAEPSGSAGEVKMVSVSLPARRLKITPEADKKSSRIPLAEATIVISGGRGVGSAEGFTQTVEALADQLGAAVGATRAIVDAGWRPYAEQVGQTGVTVQPKLYIAVGISGAVQHLSGMNKSGTIVAINKDKDAPIFRVCDFGIAGDVQQVVPALLAELRK